jgi:hypothetical protein
MRRRFAKDVRSKMRDELTSLLGKRVLEEEEEEEGRIFKGRKPILAKYVSRPMKLRTRFKGKTLTARVRRNGLIRFRGKVYSSPSVAAAAACKRLTCNGWTFWKYERAPGDWVKLNELRK